MSAAKRLKVSHDDVVALKPDVLQELFLLKDCTHPCILHTHGALWPEDDCALEDYSPPIIVTELMTHHLGAALASSALADVEVRRAILIDVAKATSTIRMSPIATSSQKTSCCASSTGSLSVQPSLATF